MTTVAGWPEQAELHVHLTCVTHPHIQLHQRRPRLCAINGAALLVEPSAACRSSV
jgi:hypothetical protein